MASASEVRIAPSPRRPVPPSPRSRRRRMRTAIVLAAGESRRMGTLKPLLPFGSGSVIGQVVRSLQACPIDAVLVVVGHRGAEIAAHLETSGLSIVENPNYLQGMLSSVQAGVAAADP